MKFDSAKAIDQVCHVVKTSTTLEAGIDELFEYCRSAQPRSRLWKKLRAINFVGDAEFVKKEPHPGIANPEANPPLHRLLFWVGWLEHAGWQRDRVRAVRAIMTLRCLGFDGHTAAICIRVKCCRRRCQNSIRRVWSRVDWPIMSFALVTRVWRGGTPLRRPTGKAARRRAVSRGDLGAFMMVIS